MDIESFDLRKEIRFDRNKGMVTFQENRLVLFDANAMGLLRQNLIDELGLEKARQFFIRFGFQNGYSDFLQVKLNYSFKTEEELFVMGPKMHSWEGIVGVELTDLKLNRQDGEFFMRGIWKNSYEAQQHLCFNEVSEDPVCWSLMGYASGWSTALMEKPIMVSEIQCEGQDKEYCIFEGRFLNDWDNTETLKQSLLPFFKQLALLEG
ncbi:MAG: XylR N-terminal domain-containing protein [Vulcanimicrobiota bacterium]